MRFIDSLSTRQLRTLACRLGWHVRYVRNWNRQLGNDGFVVCHATCNYTAVAEPLAEPELREWLTGAIKSKDRDPA